MNIFDPLASANAALWSMFANGPLGFAAQFFVDPQSTVASARPEAGSQSPVNIINEPPMARPLLAADAPSAKPRGAAVRNGPQWLSSHFEHAGQTHRFKLYVPSAYHGQSLPMVVMLHGAQQDPDDFAAGTEMNEAADAHGYIVAYPEQS